MKALLIIPARLASTRLPEKVLAEIDGKPMIAWVLQQAKQANIGEVVVAACGKEVAIAVDKAGGKFVMTDPKLPSGTDRVWAAYVAMGKPKVDVIVNLQGDLPLISASNLVKILKPFRELKVDVSTLATIITDPIEVTNQSVVKIALDYPKNNIGRAIYFSRMAIPANAKQFYRHIGVYAYRPEALEAFTSHPPCYLEKTEHLEQLRFLTHGLRVDAVVVKSAPVSVDTQADLERVRSIANSK